MGNVCAITAIVFVPGIIVSVMTEAVFIVKHETFFDKIDSF